MKKLFLTVAAIFGIAMITSCSNGTEKPEGGGGTVTQKTIKAAPDAVGDIVLKNGIAIAYYDGLTLTDQEKADAIAVIFYAGGDNELGNRKLGVGLKQESKLWIYGQGILGYHRSNALNETDGLANQNAIEV